jgi:hypothetical protein
MKAVFVITGVCEAGRSLNLDLARFLRCDSHFEMFWIDFKDPADFHTERAKAEAELPGTQVCFAPHALWGGPSIVGSMLAAIWTCAQNIPGWSHIVFCSMQDVPLVPRAMLLGTLAEIADAHDYVGSRWNANAWDLVAPLQRAPVAEDLLAERVYDRFTIRGTTTIRRETALATQYPPQSINSLRLCTELYERYQVAVSENVTQRQLSIYRMTEGRAKERFAFFSKFGLHAGRQWCVLSQRFCDLLLTGYTDDVFRDWFTDMMIPDECFFQTMASHYAKAEQIKPFWKNLYLQDAQNTLVWPKHLLEVAAGREPHQVFARKSAAAADFEAIFAQA